jgi:hypothetical protein
METIMKKMSWAAALILMILVALGVGCSTKSTDVPGGGNKTVGNIIIQMDTDTLAYLPGDTVVSQGFVLVTDQQGLVMPDVKVAISLSENFGAIEFVDPTRRDTTNSTGRVDFYFKAWASDPGSGHNTITATSGGKTVTWEMAVQPATDVISQIIITLDKHEVTVTQAKPDSVLVTVTIQNVDHNGIPNVNVRLSSSGGLIAPLPPTNSSGISTTHWYSYGTSEGYYSLTATAGSQVGRDSVRVILLQPIPGTLTTMTDKRMIRADGGVTRARITCYLKDQLGVAIMADTVRFAAPRLGNIYAIGITDSSGKTEVDFTGGDTPNQFPGDSAVVIARWATGGLSDSVRIRIEPAAQVGYVNIRPSNATGIAGVDSTAISVVATYEDQTPVTAEYAVFHYSCGHFTADSLLLTGGHPTVNLYYYFCLQKTSPLNDVKIWATVAGVSSDTVHMIAIAGPPRYITMAAQPTDFPINEQCVATATVTDSLHNPVNDGVPVSFTTTLGTLSNSSVRTAADGTANVTLTPGTQAGTAFIKGAIVSGAYADSVQVNIRSGIAGTIELTVSNPSPQVTGTGGQDWSQLMARVRDSNGNDVQDGQWVWFTILAGPGGGENINRQVQHPDTDRAQTAGGTAMVTFNSGTLTGPVMIKAWTIRSISPTDSVQISAIASNISIVAGPPKSMDIQPSDVGVDAGSAWDVTVAALVRDTLNNPVRDGIAVYFEVHGITGSDTAAILSDTVTTGNGMHLPGMAYTILRYISDATNEIVLITGRTAGIPGGFESISETVEYTLPIQQPQMSLYALPNSWHFDAQGDPCHIELVAIVTDGHDIPINKCKVIYGSSRGRLYTTRTGTTNPTSINWTGPTYGNPPYEPGHTSLWLNETAVFIFPDPNSPEITGDVTAEIEGYPDAIDAVTVNFRRNP